MPVYEIEQYELHAMRYRVDAATTAEAIQRLLAGEAEPVEQSQDFIEVAEGLRATCRRAQRACRRTADSWCVGRQGHHCDPKL